TCMTAVRRLLIIVCVLAATMTSAQTTRKRPTPNPTPAPAPEPTTVSTSPATADVPASDQATTAPVTADTDKDANDPRAPKLTRTLTGRTKTAMERSVGIQPQPATPEMAGESLRSQSGAFDWFGNGTLQHTSPETPPSTSLDAFAQRQTLWNFGVSQLIATGG